MLDDLKWVTARRTGATLHVQLNKPDHGNTLDEALLDDLIKVMDTLEQDPSVRALVLSGAGEDFCLGGDREEFTRKASEVGRIGDKTRRVYEALANAAIVTIARLHGRVIGAGVGLSISCDLRIAEANTRFRLPELALGLPTAWGGALARLHSQIGPSRTTELILTGRVVDVEAACAMALIHEVAPPGQLDNVIGRLTSTITRRSPSATRMTKQLLRACAAPGLLAHMPLLESDIMQAAVLAAHHRPEAGTRTASAPSPHVSVDSGVSGADGGP